MRFIDNWLAQKRRIARLERSQHQLTVRVQELAERAAEQNLARIGADSRHTEVREHLEASMALLGKRLTEREELLGQIVIAVGRVQVLEGQPVSSFEGLPRLVSMVVDDHEELEGRIQAVVDYLKDLPENVRTSAEIQQVGRLLQGAEPEIVDLQGHNTTEED